MKAVRYNEDTYVLKGYFKREIFKKLMNLGVKYEGKSIFFIPAKSIEQINSITSIEFIDDVVDWIYYGYYDDEAEKKSIFTIEDLNGSFIYIIDPDLAVSGIKQIKEIPYFYLNLAKIKQFNIKLNRKLYIEDFITKTNFKITNPQLNALLTNNEKGIYLHNVVNRIALDMYSSK